jgi:positive regulator of sigma E activity
MKRNFLRPFTQMGLRNGLLIYLSPLFGLGFIYSSIFEGRQSDGWTNGKIMMLIGGLVLFLGGVWAVKFFTVVRESDNQNEIITRVPRRRPSNLGNSEVKNNNEVVENNNG